MNKKYLKLFIGVFIIVGVIGVIIFLSNFQNNPINPSQNNSGSDNNVISELSKEITDYKYFSEIYKKEPTSHVKFKVGNRYIYKIWEKTPPSSIVADDNFEVLPSEYTATIYIDGAERINKETCFHILVEPTNKSRDRLYHLNNTDQKLSSLIDIGGSLYFVCQNGSRIAISTENPSDSPCDLFYAEWMLYLDKDIAWNEYIQISFDSKYQTKPLTFQAKNKVENIETIAGKKCFKVSQIGETLAVHQDGEKTEIKRPLIKNIYWIDINKRIIVKLESYEDNIPTLKMDLIDIKE
ncbi:MAG: hypothetical protein CVT88_09920 [Candidatus Altiarchaeales archaeon HGW-Altiarchaeales-1]|nr:MAG: hypothetical protein CVT88_09920 [Candidatus Altiarchaeales archaeon HGW-Altiarchaeales-1]